MSTPKLAKWLGLETLGDPQIEALVNACGSWARDVKENLPPRWLSILGKSGTGKTHCAHFLWDWYQFYHNRYCADCDHNPYFVHWPRFVQTQLRALEFGVFNDMHRWPLLVIDDIGSERDTTGFATEHLCSLLNSRIRRWTIITSNLSMRDLAQVDARIASRLIRNDSYVVQMNCPDFNLRKYEQSEEATT